MKIQVVPAKLEHFGGFDPWAKTNIFVSCNMGPENFVNLLAAIVDFAQNNKYIHNIILGLPVDTASQ